MRFEELERRKVEKLRDDANNWQLSRLISDYIKQMESLSEINIELAEWIKWAKNHAFTIDPLKNPSKLSFKNDEHKF